VIGTPEFFAGPILGVKHKLRKILVDGTDAILPILARAVPRRLPMPLWRISAPGSNPTSVSVQSRLWFNPGLNAAEVHRSRTAAITLTFFPHCFGKPLTKRRRHPSGFTSSLEDTPTRQGGSLAGGHGRSTLGEPAWLGLSSNFGCWHYASSGSCFTLLVLVFWGIFLGSNTKSQSAVVRR